MAKFVAGTAVERLEFDFTDYGGGTGFVAEPSTGRVNGFFRSMKDTMKQVKAMQASANLDGISVEEMSESELAEAMGRVDEASSGAEVLQNQTVEHIAVLCGADRVEHEDCSKHPADCPGYDVVGGSPTLDDLQTLPFRVLQAFSQWLIEQIRPKGTTNGSRPSPQDRRRSTT